MAEQLINGSFAKEYLEPAGISGWGHVNSTETIKQESDFYKAALTFATLPKTGHGGTVHNGRLTMRDGERTLQLELGVVSRVPELKSGEQLIHFDKAVYTEKESGSRIEIDLSRNDATSAKFGEAILKMAGKFGQSLKNEDFPSVEECMQAALPHTGVAGGQALAQHMVQRIETVSKAGGEPEKPAHAALATDRQVQQGIKSRQIRQAKAAAAFSA